MEKYKSEEACLAIENRSSDFWAVFKGINDNGFFDNNNRRDKIKHGSFSRTIVCRGKAAVFRFPEQV